MIRGLGGLANEERFKRTKYDCLAQQQPEGGEVYDDTLQVLEGHQCRGRGEDLTAVLKQHITKSKRMTLKEASGNPSNGKIYSATEESPNGCGGSPIIWDV